MPTSKIATHQAKYTLEQLHAELGGKIIDNAKEAIRLRESMKHVEAVLKLLDPEYSLSRIALRRKEKNRFFKRGTIFRHAMEEMRRAGKPLKCREIVDRLIAGQGVKNPKLADVRTLVGAVQSSLRNNDGKTVLSDGKHPLRWTLKP
ncbi:MAG: hypothetical protein ABSC72_12060 [Methylovirgula sp.]|jgi:hypothetical protein